MHMPHTIELALQNVCIALSPFLTFGDESLKYDMLQLLCVASHSSENEELVSCRASM